MQCNWAFLLNSFTCTFGHPQLFWSDNISMGTSIEQPIWKFLVLVSNMTKEGLKFGELNLLKAFLSWCYRPVKFIEIFEKSTVNQRSLLRFKCRKSDADTPSGKSPVTRHQRKKKVADNYSFNYSEQRAPISRSRVQLYIKANTALNGSLYVYAGWMIKKRVLQRETFSQPPKTQSSKVVELLCCCVPNKPEVRM